jgi:hypothetical protein
MMTEIDNAVDGMQSLCVTNLAEGRLTDDDAPPEVRAAASVAAEATNSLLALTDSTKEKLDEIAVREQRGELPKQGAETLRSEVTAEATALLEQADEFFEEAHQEALGIALDYFQPQVESDREALARDSFNVALGDDGKAAAARLLGMATHSADGEALAVLSTPYARTKLMSLGVSDIDEQLHQARCLVAERVEGVPELLSKLEKTETAHQAGQKVLQFAIGI